MKTNSVRAIIIEETKQKTELIKSVLPDYIKTEVMSYSDAPANIMPVEDVATIVIMNADDPKDRTLSIFKYMCTDPEKRGLKYMPAVLYTKDQFSDKAFEFYEAGEPFFHEGEIDDAIFFGVVCDAIDKIEEYEFDIQNSDDAAPEKSLESTYEPQPSPDRIMGMSFKVQNNEGAPQRTVTYSDEKMSKALDLATKSSREAAKEVLDVVDDVVNERIEAGEPVEYVKKSKTPRIAREITHNEKKKKEKLSDVKKKDVTGIHKLLNAEKVRQLLVDDDLGLYDRLLQLKGAESGIIDDLHGAKKTSGIIDDLHGAKKTSGIIDDIHGVAKTSGIIDDLHVNSKESGIIDDLGGTDNRSDTEKAIKAKEGILRRLSQQKSGADNASKGKENSLQKSANDRAKKKILVIDTDERTFKACQLFLPDTYEISFVDSNMKAVDYFIKNTADIVLIENNMPFIKGPMILNSIKMQPNGRNVRAAIFVNNAMSVDEINNIRFMSGVSAVVYKPIVKKQLIQAINMCLV